MLHSLAVTTPNQEAEVYALVVGALVAQLRGKHGWTQGELAERVGLTQSAISRIERGQARPDPYEVRALAEVFGMTTADFTKLIDDAFARTATTGKQALPTPQKNDWWGTALAVVGAIGLAGLAGFVVAAVLHESQEKGKKGAPSTKGKATVAAASPPRTRASRG